MEQIDKHLGEYLARRESADCARILGLLWDGEIWDGRDIVGKLSHGPKGSPHWMKLNSELQRMRETGLVEFWRPSGFQGGMWMHRISELGRSVYSAIVDGKASENRQAVA